MNKLRSLAPSLLAGLIFLAVLALGGFWPFGRATVDYYDMAQWAYPFYYHNFDELHGVKSFLFDWYTNLGRVIPGLNEPSVFDILFLFVPRTHILEAMSILMLIKIMAMAYTMNLFIGYIRHDLPFVYRLPLAAGYGMCGFVLINYTVPMWLDMAVFVPLILMFSQKALRTGKITGLAVTIFIIMIDDYYFTIQTFGFVFLIGGAYMIYRRFAGKKDSPEELYVLRFAAGAALGVLMSSFSWLPDIAYSMTSARFTNGTEGGLLATYLDILKQTTPAYMARWFCLLGLAFPVALALYGMAGDISKKRFGRVIFCIICIGFATAQLFLESIHLLLHFLSYVNYPMRNGFMVYCITAGVAAGLYEKKETGDKSEKNDRFGLIETAVGIVLTAAVIIAFRVWYTGHPGMSDRFILWLTMGIQTLLCFINLSFIGAAGGRFRRLCIFLWAAELVIFGIIMIGKPIYDSGYANDPEQESDYIRISDQLVAGFSDKLPTGEEAATMRVKNPDTSLNANYGVVMQRETLSGWTNLATSGQISGATSLGYSSQFTRILDAGGNIFADTILHITDIISFEDLDDRLYQKIAATSVVIDNMTGQTCEYKLYRNRYELPFAMPAVSVPDTTKAVNITDTVNAYAKALGVEGQMASVVDAKPATAAGEGKCEYTINVTGEKALYLAGNCVDTDYYNMRIYVNEKAVKIPSIKESDNELYPAHFNNNSVELGSFSDETVKVTVDMDTGDPDQVFDYYLYWIDLDVLKQLCDSMPKGINVKRERRGLTITTENLPDDFSGMLIPIPYNSGWSAKAQGRSLPVTDVGGLFMYIETEGETVISMSYFPTYMMSGIIIAVVALACLIALNSYAARRDIKPGKADVITAKIYAAAFAVAALFVYIIPFVYALKLKIF